MQLKRCTFIIILSGTCLPPKLLSLSVCNQGNNWSSLTRFFENCEKAPLLFHQHSEHRTHVLSLARLSLVTYVTCLIKRCYKLLDLIAQQLHMLMAGCVVISLSFNEVNQITSVVILKEKKKKIKSGNKASNNSDYVIIANFFQL